MSRIVSYFGNRYLDSFEQHLAEIVDHGFDTVLHCMTHADLEWGAGRMRELFAMTRDAGLQVWADPWGMPGFGGEAHSSFGRGGERTCLCDVRYRDLLRTWAETAASCGAEWAFWDEPHIACEECGTLAALEAFTGFGREFGMRNSVCLSSFEYELRRGDIDPIAALDTVDDLGVDPYIHPWFASANVPWFDHDDFDASVERYVGSWARQMAELAQRTGKSTHLWVQGFDLTEGQEELPVQAATVARREGVENIAFWSFRAAEATSRIAPANPSLVWRLAHQVTAVFGAEVDQRA